MTDAKTGPDPNARFVGSIPENYDRYLGPVLFEPYARDLAARLRAKEDAACWSSPAAPGSSPAGCASGCRRRRG